MALGVWTLLEVLRVYHRPALAEGCLLSLDPAGQLCDCNIWVVPFAMDADRHLRIYA